jgi:hypothetical protein
MRAGEADLLDMNKHFACSLCYLYYHVEAVGMNRASDALLKALPSDVFPSPDFDKPIEFVTNMKKDQMIFACDVRVLQVIEGVETLLVNMKGGVSPGYAQVLGMSPFFRKVLERCEHFMVINRNTASVLFAPQEMISGKEALASLWAKCFAAKAERIVSPTNLETFRRFSFMLDSCQQAVVDDLVRGLIHKTRAERFEGIVPICDAGESSALVACDVLAPSKLASMAPFGKSCDDAPAASSSSSSGGAEAKAAAKKARKSQLLKMFG